MLVRAWREGEGLGLRGSIAVELGRAARLDGKVGVGEGRLGASIGEDGDGVKIRGGDVGVGRWAAWLQS